CFGRDRSITHGPSREAFDDRFDRLDLCNRNRLALIKVKVEQAAQRAKPLVLPVDPARVVFENRILPRTRGVLQAENRFGVEQVEFTIAPPLILSTFFQDCRSCLARRECASVMVKRLSRDLTQTDSLYSRRRLVEILANQGSAQADSLEDLSATIALNR